MIPIAKRGSNQNARGVRVESLAFRAVRDERLFPSPRHEALFELTRSLPPSPTPVVQNSMLAAVMAAAGKLSTPPSCVDDCAHNRGMTHSDSPDQDASLGRFLTLVDTADVLNISASQAYALVRSGELPAIKVGGRGHWRVERSVLESYIEAKYEESRRMGLWKQSDYASLSEYAFGLRGTAKTTPAE